MSSQNDERAPFWLVLLLGVGIGIVITIAFAESIITEEAYKDMALGRVKAELVQNEDKTTEWRFTRVR